MRKGFCFLLKNNFLKGNWFLVPDPGAHPGFQNCKAAKATTDLPTGLIQGPKTKCPESPDTAVQAARGCLSHSSCPAQPGSGLREAGTRPGELRATLCDLAGSACSHQQTSWSGHNSHMITETVKLCWAQSSSSADVKQREPGAHSYTHPSWAVSESLCTENAEAEHRP